MNKGFLKAGHLPTLVAAFLYFDISFMVWVLLGPLAVLVDDHVDRFAIAQRIDEGQTRAGKQGQQRDRDEPDDGQHRRAEQERKRHKSGGA